MNKNIHLHIWRILPMLLISVVLSIVGCKDTSFESRQLDAADSLMELRPDSSLIILDSIKPFAINERSQRARYALLKSMALDKNYVDTTTFDVLQPAIDYYLQNGTPDEKLRTYYYQGRIFQNRNELDSALRSFMRGLDIADASKDSLTIARMLVAQAAVYVGFYDFNASSECYLRAADIWRNKHNESYEFECLTSALDGMNILNDKERADSLIQVLNEFDSMDESQKLLLHSLKVTYMQIFGSKQELRQMIEGSGDSIDYDVNGVLNLAGAYGKLGDNDKAIRQLDYLDESKVEYDTLKYLSIKYPILENLKRYEEALAVYNDFVERFETVNSAKLELNIRTMEEKHQIELQAEREAVGHARTRWRLVGGIAVLLIIILIIMLLANHYRTQKNMALHKARTAELEKNTLMAENELTRQRARTAEIENEKLILANQNLQLERDNKALEAENLAHRVETLEGEGESLREALESQKEMPEEVRKAIQTRIEMLNSYLASQISDHKEFEKAYDAWVEELTADTEEFMNSNRLALQASHPAFIKYFEDHGLTVSEINYVCLYAIGLRGKDVGLYMKKRSHVNTSSDIRRKLGIDRHETNIGIYVRKLFHDL